MEIRRLLAAATLSLVAATTVTVLPSSGSVNAQPVPKDYYLAVGDSIAYGFDPGKRDRPTPSDTGYVDPFAAKLRKLSPKIRVVNYSCPGESTVTFTKSGCPHIRDGGKLHDPYAGPQLDAALAFLRTHKGMVSPITVTLWGNDLAPLTARGKKAPQAIASFASRFDSILKRLRAAAPSAVIIVTGAWNPEVNQAKKTQPLYRLLDAAIARTAAASRARVAKMYAVYNPRGDISRVCKLTYICSHGDPHPNAAGYKVLADAHFAASAYGRP